MQRYSQVNDVSLAMGVFLAHDEYDYNDDPYTISATTLLKPLRQIILAARIPKTESLVPLADQIASRMGTALHNGFENAWVNGYEKAMQAMGFPQRVIDKVAINPTDEFLLANPDCLPFYMEQRLSKKIGKWTVTGKFDFIGEGTVQDVKSTGTYTYTKQTNDKKYPLQGSIYRWLDPKKITEDVMLIHYIFTDWASMRAKQDPSYPQRRFHTQPYNLLSLSETEHFIRNKIALIEKYWDAEEEDIPDCDAEDLWRSEAVFKYYKNPAKTSRSIKNFDNLQDALIRKSDDGNVGIIEEVPGRVMACHYCPAFDLCTQKDRLIAEGSLEM